MKLISPVPASLAFAVFALAQDPVFSNYYASGVTLGGNFIRESFTRLVLPATNKPVGESLLKIYPALYTNGTASLTGTAFTVGDGSADCEDPVNKWCVGARLVVKNVQNSGAYVSAAPGTQLEVFHKYNHAVGKYEQKVSIAGKVVSFLALDDDLSLEVGVAVQFATWIECQRAGCGTLSSHRYIDTRLVLNAPDPDFGKRSTKEGARGGAPVSNDGGLTWTYGDIIVDGFTWT